MLSRACSLRCAFALLLAIVAACAQLPEYARPRTITSNDAEKLIATGFTYRQLTPRDFQAPSYPGEVPQHGENIRAQSTVTIRITGDSKFRITAHRVGERVQYVGGIDRLAFEAVMIPGKSWWNPKVEPARAGYVLQHEQIHFAITELGARKLTSDAREWTKKFSVTKDTPE
ncbi:MAG TPA: hypothetical protein VLS90_08040 [Thermodesulfobacteriota bacterium]|nr:hypothetical protein [Thermodesulfobacteriota bacterium]